VANGGVRQAAAAIPAEAGRHALITAYQTGFVSTFDHLMGISAVVAMIGAVGTLILVRQKDFVPSIADGELKPAGDGNDGDAEGDGDADDDGSAWTAAAHAG